MSRLLHRGGTAGAALFAALALCFAARSAPLAAQDSSACVCGTHAVVHSALARRSAGVFTVIQSRPLGAMARNIGFGYGGDAAYLLRLDHAGVVSLRADAGFVQYGSYSKRVALSQTVGDRVQVDVGTDNDIAVVSIGPQVAAPAGLVRPYANAGIGAQFFFTDSHVNGANDAFDFANTTNQHDWTPVWVGGAGVTIPLVARDIKVLLDAGVQYLEGGHARYLRPDSIQDLPGGSIAITPLESDTHMALVHLGVRLTL